MNRIGVRYDQVVEFLRNVSFHAQLELKGVFTHFATADCAETFDFEIQARRFVDAVNATPTASVVLENQVLQFPYDLDITGAPGISEGTLYLSEQVNGVYQELGNYSITFAKVE